ncbi:MAG: type II secretion system protein [Pseudohongiella sp.]|nr:type II secretion system protein [Pseudohongiella sp.]
MQVQTRKGQQGFTIIELVVVILLLGILAATALPRFIDVTEQAHDAVFSGVGGSVVTGTALYRAEWVARGQPASNTELQSYGNLRVAPGFSVGAYVAETPGDASTYTAATAFSGRASGYPYAVGVAPANNAAFTATNCKQVFDNLLQIGAPVAVATSGVPATDFGSAATAAAIRSAVAAAQTASAGDFQVFVRNVQVDTGFADNAAGGGPRLGAGLARNHQQEAPACVYAYSAEAENNNRFILYVPWNGRTQIFTSAADLLTALTTFDGPAV